MLFEYKIKNLFFITILVILHGCALNSGTNLNINKKPLSTHSTKDWTTLDNFTNQEYLESNINNFKLFFEDYKPHSIGDTLTVILQEDISASNNISNNLVHNGNSNLDIGLNLSQIFNFNYDKKVGLKSTTSNNFLGKGSSFANNKFIGLITVVIDQILPNGNLIVKGSKNILVNEGKEKILFSGIVNPRTISKNNSVISTQIADTHIEYISSGNINQGGKINWLQRFFVSVLTI